MTGTVAVVIVNYRAAELTLGAVAALAAERDRLPSLRCVVVDGGSGDGSAERLAAGLADPACRGWTELLPLALNGGFGWANNQAMLRLLQGPEPPDYIHLLNPDTRVELGAVAALARTLDAHPECGAAGSLLIDPDGTPSGSAFRFPSMGREFAQACRMAAVGRLLRIAPGLVPIGQSGPVDWVTGASVMLRGAALKASGLFDDGFFLYFEEMELMWRIARAGWTIRHVPESRVVHVGGAATGINMAGASRKRPRMPAYWYASRRRLFTRIWGPAGPLRADLAWLAGRALSLVRALVPRRAATAEVERQTRDMMRYGLRSRPADRKGAVVRWTDPPGAPPAWQRRWSATTSARSSIPSPRP